MNFINLTQDKLVLEDISKLVESSKCSMTSILVGTTSENFGVNTIVKLEYEVNESMGIKCMEDIIAHLRKKWPSLEHIAIYHRYGTVPIQEASVIIAISSPHQAESMAATQACIDEVKKSVSIWKKEIFKEFFQDSKKNKESKTYPPKICFFKLDRKPEVKPSFIAPHLVQIKIDSNELDTRIRKFIKRKREEINESNIRDFCPRTNMPEESFGCARVDGKFARRKDSKGHLQVNRSFNEYYPDQHDLKYMKKYQAKDGIEERIKNTEIQIGFKHPTDQNIYKRLKSIEERLLHIESISPEYIQFFGRNLVHKASSKKRIFSVSEIESMIVELESKKTKTNVISDQDNI